MMYLVSLLSFSLLLPPALAAATYGTCTINSGQNGVCMSTGDCKSSKGKSEAGHCPGGTDIQCCTYGSCKIDGVPGLCQPTSTCGGGKSTPGYCPGNNDIQCCTYRTCKTKDNPPLSGQCQHKSLCKGTGFSLHPGVCPGNDNVQCCTYKWEGCSPAPAPDVNQPTKTLIKSKESWVPTVYHVLDEKLGTIGWGHHCSTTDCSEIKAKYSYPLSPSDGEKIFNEDLGSAKSCIKQATKPCVVLNANQYGALVSVAYNTGCGSAENSNWMKRLNNCNENPNTIAEQELPTFGRKEVWPRRKEELALFKTPSSEKAIPAGQICEGTNIPPS